MKKELRVKKTIELHKTLIADVDKKRYEIEKATRKKVSFTDVLVDALTDWLTKEIDL